MSDSLRSHGLQHPKISCPSPTHGAYSNWCPLIWWRHPTIPSSVAPLSSCPQFFRASGSFPKSQLFTSGGQSIRVSASASILPMNIQDCFPSGLTCLISFVVQGTLKRLLQNHSSKSMHCSLLELQMGTVMAYHRTPHRRAISRTPTTVNVGKNVEKGQPPCTVDGNVNWNSHYGEKYGDSLKKKLGINQPYDPTIPLLGMFPEETTSDKDACTAVFYLQ